MDPLIISAASGMRARMESLEMLANNIANAATGGYKGDREFYSLYASEEALAGDELGATSADRAPLIDRRWTDFAQGALRQTSNPLDVALEGTGFFAANGPKGLLFTRNGNFRVNAAGVLTTADGYPLRTADGRTVQLASQDPLTIDRAGNITQNGQALGQLAIVDVPESQTLDKQGLNYFFSSDPALKTAPSNAVVHQGQIEDSNVVPAQSAVRLVEVMRQFESLQKALNIGADMNRYVIEQVARVNP